MIDIPSGCAVKDAYHIPVMFKEVIEYLNLKPGDTIVDATIGTGGHSLRMLERIMPSGRLIGIDRDAEALAMAKQRLQDYGQGCDFVHGNFVDINGILKDLNIQKVDGIVMDLGISSFQLENPERGFSFQADGPLDMRLDRASYISAYDLMNNLNEEEISALLWNFGQERWHNRIARLLIRERAKRPISTTRELANIVVRAIPYKYRHYRIHPATRTFQAVRIAVNRELETLSAAMVKAIELLAQKGRLCVISFHSLEDRIVKLAFREASSKGVIKILTPKPLTPADAELRENPSCRSAKFRAAEKA